MNLAARLARVAEDVGDHVRYDDDLADVVATVADGLSALARRVRDQDVALAMLDAQIRPHREMAERCGIAIDDWPLARDTLAARAAVQQARSALLQSLGDVARALTGATR